MLFSREPAWVAESLVDFQREVVVVGVGKYFRRLEVAHWEFLDVVSRVDAVGCA